MKKQYWILHIAMAVIILAAGIWIWSKITNEESSGLPQVSMVAEGNKWPVDGFPVGADYLYVGWSGNMEQFCIPSLQGVWQLDEPYERSVVKIDDGLSFVTLSCTHETDGTIFGQPRRIDAVRFDQSVITLLPSDDLVWEDGTEVPVEKHGKTYRIMNPEVNSVYVIRTVWDSGVLEHAWLTIEE